jgi:hypothetical protein
MESVSYSGKTNICQFPEEILLLILGFVDAETRLRLLEYAGFFQKIVEQLEVVPNTLHSLQKYYTCLTMIEPFVYKYWSVTALDEKRIVPVWHKDSLEYYQEEAKKGSQYAYDYMKRIILLGITDYTRMYMREKDRDILIAHEKRLLRVNILLHTFFMTKKIDR